MMGARFRELAELADKLEGMRKRGEAVKLVSTFLRRLEPNELEPTVCMLLGRPFTHLSGERLEVSWATLRDLILSLTGTDRKKLGEVFGKTGDLGATVAILFQSGKRQEIFAGEPLGLLDVQTALREVAKAKGPGAREKRKRLLEGLLLRSDPLEAKYLVKIIIGEMRTGFGEGLMELAVAEAFKLPKELVGRATMFAGDVATVARLAVEGEGSLRKLGPEPFKPIRPMMAQVAETVADAIRIHGGKTVLEYKLDGARIQIHKRGEKVRIFSRRLTDVTHSLPEIIRLIVEELRAGEAIVEGEVIAVDKEGFPIPFQFLLHRFKRERDVERMVREVPLKLQIFDLLYLDGESLVDASQECRRRKLEQIAGKIELTERLLTSSPEAGQEFLNQAFRAGHEGLMAKEPGSPYTPGIRGKRWLKIKPVLEPLDLVIVGAEFGYGRRRAWLSDYYLAARDERTGKFEVVGKTFKGLTDEEMREMTRRLQELAVKREPRRVWVLPRIVVEVIYNEIQRSSKYPCGMALRFARIKRIRDDKLPDEANTLEEIRKIFVKQVKKHGFS
jgi:DNA ligase-1